MKKHIDIGIIGGGSIFSPEMIDILAQYTDDIGEMTVRLMDTDSERLKTVGAFCERIVTKLKKPVNIVYTDTYEDTIKDTDFVLIQFRVGGEEARISDDRIGMKYKIPFVETVSVCGLASFLRTYYQMEIIADLTQKYAPKSWIMNFANPSGALTEALYRLGCSNVMGVCNAPCGSIGSYADRLGTKPESVFMNWRGLNHLSVVDGVFYNGENVYERLLDEFEGDQIGPYTKDFVKKVGYTPNGYLQYIYNKEQVVEKLQAQETTRAEDVLKVNKEILSLYSTIDSLPEKLKERGGFGYSRGVADIIKGLSTNIPSVHYPSIRNGSTIPELHEDAFIEVPALISKNGVRAVQVEPLPETVKSIVITMKQYERALFEAARKRDKNLLFKAMLINPLFGSQCLTTPILDEVLTANAAFLPTFN